MSLIDQYVERQGPRMLGELKELLRIPSVSADRSHDDDCRAAAEWLAGHLRSLGCPRVSLLGSETHPVVHAEGPRVEGRPTVIVYGHYDVQPPEPLELWDSPPFEPTERDGNLVARGATDDKGQMFALVKAFEVVTRGGRAQANVRFVLEGQEESGGEVVLGLARERPELFEADVAVVADGPYYAPGWPSVVTGLRGICYAEIVVRTLRDDVHSGLYGGVAPNALETLLQVLARLKGPSGRIRIPGLYDAVRRPHRRERASWKALPFDAEAFERDEVGARALTGERRYSPRERIWSRPSLDVHGIVGGFTGEGVKTVIPAEARAKVSLRIVPDQRAETVFRQLAEAVAAATPRHAEAEVRLLVGADPVLLDVEHEAFAHIDRAFREVEGRGVTLTRSGGSIPIIGELATRGAPVVIAGIGLPDDRLHAPNEKFALDQYFNGIRVYARFLKSMGDPNRRTTT